MACFLAPAVEAVATTVASRIVRVKDTSGKAPDIIEEGKKSSLKMHFVRRMNWLSNMLWGGSALLAFEHMWHGEITPWFPFLTAAKSSSDVVSMFQEIGTVGVSMAALVTAVWAGMVAVSYHLEKKALQETDAIKQEG